MSNSGDAKFSFSLRKLLAGLAVFCIACAVVGQYPFMIAFLLVAAFFFLLVALPVVLFELLLIISVESTASAMAKWLRARKTLANHADQPPLTTGTGQPKG